MEQFSAISLVINQLPVHNNHRLFLLLHNKAVSLRQIFPRQNETIKDYQIHNQQRECVIRQISTGNWQGGVDIGGRGSGIGSAY